LTSISITPHARVTFLDTTDKVNKKNDSVPNLRCACWIFMAVWIR